MQRRGVDEVRAALENEVVNLILVQKDCPSSAVKELLQKAHSKGIPVREGAESDLWRMAIPAPDAPLILALVGRAIDADLEQVLASDSVVWMLCGVRYAVNIGYVIRTAEISGAAGLIICGEFTKTEQKTALRASMQTDRFIPVFWISTTKALEAISNSGRRLVSVEDVGTVMPWESDVKGNPVICVGGEHDGIPEQVISASDQVIRLPMAGFVPSYNLQTAMGVVAIEAMKQNNLGK